MSNPPKNLFFLVCALASAGLAVSLRAQDAPAAPAAAAPQSEVVRLSPFAVETTSDHGYSSANELGASRVNIPLFDVPTSVTVLNEAFLQDQAALDANTAFKYVSGMNTTNLIYNGQITVRGFQSGDGIAYVDGLPADINVDGAAMNDLADVERVEVIKGPNGVLYGSHVPGGVVDEISKQPLFSPQTQLDFVAGPYGLYRGEIDTTGPIGKNFAYRVIYMRQEGETVNHGPFNKTMFEPSFTWVINDTTKLTGRFEYYSPNAGTSRTQWFEDAAGALSTFISPRTYYDDQDEHREHWIYFTDVELTHVLNENWQFRLVGRNIDGSENKLNYAHGTFSFVGANNAPLLTSAGAAATFTNYTFAQAFANPLWQDILVSRTRELVIYKQKNPAAYFDLVGNFNLGPIQNKLVTSVQYTETSTDNKETLWNYPSIDIFHPVYYFPNTLGESSVPRAAANTIAWADGYAGGIQDNVSAFGDRLDVVFGARYDHNYSQTLNRLTGAYTANNNDQKSYRAGLLYKVTSHFALFGDVSQTFIPVSGVNAFGTPFQNQIGTIHEAGFKVDGLSGRLSGTFSVFDLKETNAIEQVIVNVAQGLVGQFQTNYNRARGWDSDWTFQASDAVDLVVGVGDKTTKDGNGIPARGVGQGFDGKAFVKYRFVTGPIKGAFLGAGYIYNNKVPGTAASPASNAASPFFLPAYSLVEGLAGYASGPWRVQVNVDNLLNKTYAAGSVSNAFIFAGLPRNTTASFTYKF